MEGTPFGRYRLIELLGRGGMGEVWRAHDTLTNRDVAIKLLPPHLAQDNTFVQRFRREAEAAARVNSPHIIPIHDYGEIDGRLFVNMRLVEGQDLQEVLADGRLDPARAVRIIEQVAKALQAAHRIGLVHRDVKPSNILLDEDDFAYLIDFGIARGADETRLTGTGAMVGSWHYMSPERLQAGQVDARADIYALACVLYECLTGSTPFPGDNVEQQITAHLIAPPPRPSSTDPNVPATFDRVIATGMAKNPDNRYATTVELANAAHGAITTPIPRPAQNLRTPADFVTNPAPPTPATERAAQQRPPADLNRAATQQRPPSWPPVPQTRPTHRPPPQIDTPPPPWEQRPRRRLMWPLIAALVVILAAAGITATAYLLRAHSPASQTPTAQPSGRTAQPAPPSGPTSTTSEQGTPITPTALEGLLLSPAQINAAMGSTGMTAGPTFTSLGDDSATVSDKACLPLYAPAQAQAYANSGWAAMRGQQVADHQTASVITSFVIQNVVLFPSAHDAGAFFTASAQSWPACSNRQFTLTLPGKPNQVFSVGPVSNTGVTLSATSTQDAANGVTCLRALTVANNVAVDIVACSFSKFDPTNNPAVNIAHEIAAKVPTT